MRPTTCGDCRYFAETATGSSCHRYTPDIVTVDGGALSAWPTVMGGDVACGEGESKHPYVEVTTPAPQPARTLTNGAFVLWLWVATVMGGLCALLLAWASGALGR